MFSSFPICDFEPPETSPLGGQGAQGVTLLAPGPSAASSGAGLATPEMVDASVTRLGQQPGETEARMAEGAGLPG